MLVERNPEPNGIPLVNSKRVATKGFQEMMELEEDHLLVRTYYPFKKPTECYFLG